VYAVPNFNVYQQFILEVDTRFGEYNECNPDPRTGVFKCEAGHGPSRHGGSHCWYSDPEFAKEFASVCSRASCTCDVVTEKSVGREFVGLTMGHMGPPSVPVSAKCKAAVEKDCGTEFGKQQACAFCVQLHAHALMASCTQQELQSELFASCFGGGGMPGMNTFRWTGGARKNNRQCTFFYAIFLTQDPMICLDRLGIDSERLTKTVFSLSAELAAKLNGTWYSTQAAGECPDGAAVPGDGSCWWRVVEITRTVNATCVNNNLIDSVKHTNPSCWTGCPQPSNTSSTCWVDCLCA
jgi:hypothetical protein